MRTDGAATPSAPVLLVVHPDPGIAGVLRDALRARVRAEVIVADSKDAALAVLDNRVPDLVLLHDLTTPEDEEHLLAYLAIVPRANHVQTISIPQLVPPAGGDGSAGTLLRSLKRCLTKENAIGCDPRLFAADVLGYLREAAAVKAEADRRAFTTGQHDDWDRRRGQRWPRSNVPWVSSVRLPTGQSADLINVSTGGSLIRSRVRPDVAWLKRRVDVHPRSGLTFQLETGEEIRAAGRVIRCRPRPTREGVVLYEVAFQFDRSISLDLPSAGPQQFDQADGGMALEQGGGEADARDARNILDCPASVQNELLKRVLRDTEVPSSVRHAVSEVTRLNAALLQIRSAIGRAHGPALLDLARVLGPRVRELNVMRRNLVASISRDDIELIAALTSRSGPPPRSNSDGGARSGMDDAS